MTSHLVETSTNHCKKVVGKFSEKCSVKTSNGTSKDHRTLQSPQARRVVVVNP